MHVHLLLAGLLVAGAAPATGASAWFHVSRAVLTDAVLPDREPGAAIGPSITPSARPTPRVWLEVELTAEGVAALRARRNMPVLVVWRQGGQAFRRPLDIGIDENALRAAPNGIFRWRTWADVPLERAGAVEAVVQDARRRFVRRIADAAMFRMEVSVQAT